MRRRLAFAVTVAATLLPAPAVADDERLFAQGVSLELGGGASAPDLADAAFTGVGRTMQGAPLSTFQSTGRELGLVRPWFGTFDVGMRYTRVPFYFGAVFSYGRGGDDATPSPQTTSIANPTSVTFVLGGGEAGLEYPFDRFGVRLGEVGAFREVDVPLDGYQPTSCDSRLCYPSAHSRAFVAQTRVALAWWPLDEPAADLGAGVGLNVYGAIDELPASGWSVGLALTLHIGAYEHLHSVP